MFPARYLILCVSAGLLFGKYCESLRENAPEESLKQLTEAVASYSRGRPQQDEPNGGDIAYLPK